MNTNTSESETADARKAIDSLYTPLDEALELLRQRRADEKLRAAVSNFHYAHPPDFLPNVPCAFWTRHISTPNSEFSLFVSTVSTTGLQPLCLEYPADIFVACNHDKYHLCRPFFEVRPKHFRGLRIIDDFGFDGRRLCDFRLMNGMSLPSFHHALLTHAFPGFERHLRDYSHWFSAARRAEDCYLHYLALFIFDGILFDNFVSADPEERRFACRKVQPCFAKAVETFGVKPLIVRLLPTDTENDEHWRAHPGALHRVAYGLLHDSQKEINTCPGRI
jgi:hypothetical protein